MERLHKQQQTGMQGVYLVAAELAARGLIVSPTSRSAAGADLLVTDTDCNKAYSVQVKTRQGYTIGWPVGKKAKAITSRQHVYVFVHLKPNQPPQYFVVPSTVVARHTKTYVRPNSIWYTFTKQDAARYENRWRLLGAAPTAPTSNKRRSKKTPKLPKTKRSRSTRRERAAKR